MQCSLKYTRDLKERRRRRREIRDGLDLFGTAMALITGYSYRCNDGVQLQMEIRKISRRRPRFIDTAKFGHFTSLFCRGRQRNVPRIKTHVHSYCSRSRRRRRRPRGLLKLPSTIQCISLRSQLQSLLFSFV